MGHAPVPLRENCTEVEKFIFQGLLLWIYFLGYDFGRYSFFGLKLKMSLYSFLEI